MIDIKSTMDQNTETSCITMSNHLRKVSRPIHYLCGTVVVVIAGLMIIPHGKGRNKSNYWPLTPIYDSSYSSIGKPHYRQIVTPQIGPSSKRRNRIEMMND